MLLWQSGGNRLMVRKEEKKYLVIPGISLSKLQLQSVVDLVMSVSISDMQNVFT